MGGQCDAHNTMPKTFMLCYDSRKESCDYAAQICVDKSWLKISCTLCLKNGGCSNEK